MSTVLDLKIFFSSVSDTHTFMLAVSYHISEKETEHGRMIKGCLCPKTQKIRQNKNDGIRIELKDYFGALKIYPSIHDTVNVISL